VCRNDPTQKGRYIKIILTLLSTNNTSVIYECANTLVALSSAPTAIKAAANCYCQLLVSQSDNNVKLIVLDRLAELKDAHRYVMQEMVMDILRAVSAPNPDIRKKTLDIVLDLVTSRNIDEVVAALKKEITKSQTDNSSGDAGEYRQMLVQAVHRCAVRFPDVAGAVVNLLMDFLGDANTATAFDVAMFVREIAQTNEHLRDEILKQLLDCFYSIRSSRVCGTCLWIVGEFSLTTGQIEESFETLKQSLGATPFYTQKKKHSQWEADPEQDDQATQDQYGKRHFGEASEDSMKESKRKGPVVLADGSYATQTASSADVRALAEAQVPNLRSLVLAGDFFLASVISTTLTKLAVRYINLAEDAGVPPSSANRLHAECMLYIVCMLRLGEGGETPTPIDSDSTDRMMVCVNTLAKPQEADVDVWLNACRSAYDALIADKVKQKEDEEADKDKPPVSQADDLIDFYHLKSRKGMSQVEIEDAVATDLKRATGFGAGGSSSDKKSTLERVIQLTGFSDPVYAEAYVTVHQYDIVMDVTVVNRTSETQQNLALELATMGDLKLVERPQSHTLAPGETKHIRANIKVSSTETGVIFGNIVFESTGSDRNVVVLNDVHIDIMDYIAPAWCEDNKFRSMWAEFEWENKVAVNTTIPTVREFLEHIVESTNMRCLTPPSALEGDCGYLAANLYAKSVFGEDALVNVSVEEQDGVVSGFIRIRSKTQGIALSLGDKITLKQRTKVAPK
jgi:coatomer subunit beta